MTQAPIPIWLIGVGLGQPRRLSERAIALIEGAEIALCDPDTPPAIRAALPDGAYRPATSDPEANAERLAALAEQASGPVIRVYRGDGWVESRASEEAALLQARGARFEILVGPAAQYSALACEGVVVPPERVPSIKAGAGEVTWYRDRPLHGMRIAITRSAHQSAGMINELRDLGAEITPCPVIDIQPPPDPTPLDEALAHLPRYQWIIFTSTNGVDRALEALLESGLDIRALGHMKIACIGPATAKRLRRWGLRADLHPPTRYVAEGLLDALDGVIQPGERVWLPRALEAREILPETLRARGVEVDVIPVYATVAGRPTQAALSHILSGGVELVTLTASSTATHFRGLFDDAEWAQIRGQVKAACIGPITAATAEAVGLEVALVAERYTVPGLREALTRWWAAQR